MDISCDLFYQSEINRGTLDLGSSSNEDRENRNLSRLHKKLQKKEVKFGGFELKRLDDFGFTALFDSPLVTQAPIQGIKVKVALQNAIQNTFFHSHKGLDYDLREHEYYQGNSGENKRGRIMEVIFNPLRGGETFGGKVVSEEQGAMLVKYVVVAELKKLDGKEPLEIQVYNRHGLGLVLNLARELGLYF